MTNSIEEKLNKLKGIPSKTAHVEKYQTPASAGNQLVKRPGTFKKENDLRRNMEGRIEGSKNFKTLWHETIIKMARQAKGMSEEDIEKVLIEKAFNEAKKGNFNFYRDIMDRRFGKVPTQIGNAEEQPFKLGIDISHILNKVYGSHDKTES